ncbi:MAG: transposase [Ignavibacteriales bacterium]|nr:transposase [Ignavibacteriales bacterium]
MLITRKIELHISEADPELRKEHWKYLSFLNSEIYKAANLIVTNQLFNNFLENRVVDADGNVMDIGKRIRSLYRNKDKNADEIEKLKAAKLELRTEVKKFYLKSKQNTTYSITSHNFPEIDASIITTLNAQITGVLKKEWNEVERGSRSLRTYKKGMPIPFNLTSKSKKWFEKVDDEIFLTWFKGIKFKLFFGRDRSNNRAIVDRCLSGEYKYSDSSIQYKDRKIFLLLVVDIPESTKVLDENVSVGVDLGITVPAYCALSDGLKRLAIGSSEDLLRVRLQFQSRKRRLQRALKSSKGGQGRDKKLKALDNVADKEKRYVSTYNHMISSNIVKFAKDNNAGVIKLEMLEGFGEDEKNKFILRNWSYYQLQTMIQYKAKRENIKLVFIDPYHTSQTCSICNHYEAGQREKQSEFICKNPDCKNFDTPINADFNAALNIAVSKKVVTSKEDCEYFKKEN